MRKQTHDIEMISPAAQDTEMNAPTSAVENTSDNQADVVRIPLSRIEFILVYIGLLLAIFLSSLDSTVVSTALKTIAQDLGQQELLPWIGSAYLLTAAPIGTLYGKMADIFGRKWVFVFAIMMFEVGSIICGVATSMVMLVVGRAVAGVGGGGMFSLVLIIISDIVSMRDRGKFQGLIGAVFGLSSVIAPLIGGALSDNGLWRWCFFINLPLGAVTLTAVITFLKIPTESGSVKEKVARIDFLGAALLLAAVLCFVTPLQLGGSTWEWKSAQVIVLFVLSVVLLSIFAYVELKVAKEPIIPPSIFANRSAPALLVISFCFGAAFLSGVYYMSLFFQVVYGSTATQAGLYLLPYVAGLVFTSIGSGLLISKFGKYIYFLYFGPVILTAGIILTSYMNSDTPLVARIFYLFIFGLGGGCLSQVRVLAMQSSVPFELIAIATAVLQTCNTLGSSVGIAVTGTIFNNLVSANSADKTDLQSFIALFASQGASVDATDVSQLLSLLSAASGSYPTDTAVSAATYNESLASARSEITSVFNGAFKVAYLSLLPYVALVLIMSFLVKQVDVGAKKVAGGKKVEEPGSPEFVESS